MAAPSLRASSAVTVAQGTAATTVAVTQPAEVQVGDLMTVGIGAGTNSGTCTPPTGWLRLPRFGGHAGGLTGRAYGYYKYATANDVASPPTWTFTFQNESARALSFAAFKDVDPNIPFGSARFNSGTDDIALAQGYPLVNDSLLVAVHAGDTITVDESAASLSGGSAANWTTRAGVSETTSRSFSSIRDNATDGATASTSGVGSSTFTLNPNTSSQVVTLSLNPILTKPIVARTFVGGSNFSGQTTFSLPGVTSGDTPQYCLLPGFTLVATYQCNNESADFTGAALNTNGQAMTALGSGMRDLSSGDAVASRTYMLVLDESDTWNTSAETILCTAGGSYEWSGSGLLLALDPASELLDFQYADQTSNTTSPNPPGVIAWPNGVVITWAMNAGDDAASPTAPSGYTLFCDRSTGNNNNGMTAAHKAMDVSVEGTEDPGAFGSMTNDEYLLATLSIGPLGGAGAGGGSHGRLLPVVIC